MMISLKTFCSEWKIKGNKGRFFMFFGGLFLLFALIGTLLPIIPQVPFAIISAYFFSKGSTRIHFWMRYNKFFGRPVREWEDFKVVRPKMKVIASLFMLMGAIIGHSKLGLPVAYSLDAIFAASIAYVLTRRSSIFSFLS